MAARTVPAAAALVAALAVLPALVTRARGGHDFTLALAAAAVVAGSGAGFVADDQAANVLASSPTTLLARRALRAATVTGLLAGAMVTAVLLAASAPGAGPALAGPLTVLAASAGLAVAIAFDSRNDGPLAPGVTSAIGAALSLLTVSVLSTRWSWVPHVAETSLDRRWLAVATAGVLIAVVRSQDPARRAGRRLPLPPLRAGSDPPA